MVYIRDGKELHHGDKGNKPMNRKARPWVTYFINP